MFRLRVHSLILASILVLTISGGGLLHAAIPHSHGDDHGGRSESTIWTGLHSALRHDDKKALFMVTETFVLLVLLMFGNDLGRTAARLHACLREFRREQGDDPMRGMALRRGILRYRAFG